MVCNLISAAQVTVATSGTEQPVVAADVQKVVVLYLSAPSTNTTAIVVGGSNVSTTIGALIEKGTTLKIEAPQGEFLDIRNIFVDTATNGDKVNVAYLVKV